MLTDFYIGIQTFDISISLQEQIEEYGHEEISSTALEQPLS